MKKTSNKKKPTKKIGMKDETFDRILRSFGVRRSRKIRKSDLILRTMLDFVLGDWSILETIIDEKIGTVKSRFYRDKRNSSWIKKRKIVWRGKIKIKKREEEVIRKAEKLNRYYLNH